MKDTVKFLKEVILKQKEINAKLDLTINKNEIDKLIEKSKDLKKAINEKGYDYNDNKYFHNAMYLLLKGSVNRVTITDVCFDVERTVKLLYEMGVLRIDYENSSTECLEFIYELSKYYEITERYLKDYKSDRPCLRFELKKLI